MINIAKKNIDLWGHDMRKLLKTEKKNMNAS
jgi:hypothetical protein